MQIVIDIPKDVYKRTVFYREFRDLSDCVATIKALEKATPLPKGHGKLIDADETISKICGSSCGCHLEECGHDEPCFSVTRIESAPTIIEADKPTYGCSSCPHSGSIIDGYVDCPDAYTKQSQYCGLNNKEG